MITIYKTTCIGSGKIYVGQRSSKSMKSYYGSGVYIKRAIKKLGKNRFIVEEIDYAYSNDEANQKETFWIQECDCLTPRGYNICPEGGTKRGSKFSMAQRAKQRISAKKRWEDPARRDAQRVAMKKRCDDPVQKAKLSAAQKKRFEDPVERAKSSVAQKKRFEDPVERAKQSVDALKRWSNSAQRVKLSAARSGQNNPMSRTNRALRQGLKNG